ncbi:MAG: AMP-binding protein [Crocinitomicaceae bacterium]|nr:AMP-binding protein [Crocinitomicaceae bacterium]
MEISEFKYTEKSLKSLFDVINYAKSNSPYYQKTIGDFLLKEDSFSLEAYKQLPFTTKDDLASNNDKFLAVPLNKVADFVTTSGTTGNPISLFLTKNDLERLATNERDSFKLMGKDHTDVFQLLTTIDKQFMAGIAYFLGVQKLGAGMIRIGPGVPQLQWNSILKYKPSTLIAVPSFIVTLLDYARENNIDFNSTSVKSIVCIGEPIRNEDLSYNKLGARILENWDVQIFSTYASTEMGAAFSECTAQQGCHLNDDLLFMEVLKEDGTEARHEESGEIVVTTLGVEGSPLIRYRTGDIAKVYRNTCSCGRNTPRLGPIIGRKNQMIKYRGTTLFPKAIFDVLEEFKVISCYKVIIDKDELNNDIITVLLEDKLKPSTINEVKELCKSKLRVIPKFEFMEINKLRGLVHKKHMRKPEKIKFN